MATYRLRGPDGSIRRTWDTTRLLAGQMFARMVSEGRALPGSYVTNREGDTIVTYDQAVAREAPQQK